MAEVRRPSRPILFAVLLGAAAASPFAVALVMAVVGAIAADETLRVRCRNREQADRQILCDSPRLTTILGAMGLPLVSSSNGGVNALVLSFPLLILIPMVNRLLTEYSGDPVEQRNSLIEMSWAFMASVTFGSLGAALVLIDRMDATTAIVLILLVAVYDLSNFLIGSGPGAGWEGPAAGVVAVAIAGFASWVAIGPSVGTAVIVAMVGCIWILGPLGPVLMSVLIGNDEQAVLYSAGAIRHLDVLVVCIPVAAYLIAAFS